MSDRPLDAVARGAAAFAAGTDFYDHIQHDYAVRWFDRETGRYEYRTCVNAGTELVCDPSGAWRVREVSAEDDENRSRFWINEGSPTFLRADPPATAGQARFRVEFGIDGNKRLLLTAYDLISGRVTHRDYPVVKLT